MLVLMGATAEGSKELIAVADGFRESEQCWKELLLDAKSRGMTIDRKRAIGDGRRVLEGVAAGVHDHADAAVWMHKTGSAAPPPAAAAPPTPPATR